MNKRTAKIVLGAIIAIVVIGVSAKPLLIKYHLYKYSRIPAISQIMIHPDSFDLSDAKNDINHKSDIISALQRLGYLTSFSIPITTHSANAEAYINGISTYTDAHAIPLVVGIDDSTSDTSLFVIDKPGSRPFWESFVRHYVEARSYGPPSVAQCVVQGAPAGDP